VHSGSEWTDEKQRFLRLVLEGLPIAEIARRLRRHRNTLRQWRQEPVFQRRLNQELQGTTIMTRLRRLRVAAMVTNKLEHFIKRAYREYEARPTDANQRRVLDFTDEWRRAIVVERLLLQDV
jgi:hypothetical protein